MNAPADSSSAEASVSFAAALRAAAATPRFWASVALQSIPVIGVFKFGWSAQQIGVYFVMQSWLMLSIYSAADSTFDPKILRGKAPPHGLMAVLKFAKTLLIHCVVVAVAIIWLAMYLKIWLFGSFFNDGEYAQRTFLIGVGALVLGCVIEGVRYVRALPNRTPRQIAADDSRAATLAVRVILLFLFGIFIGIFQAFGDTWGNAALVIAIALVQIICEVLPYTVTAKPEQAKT